MKLNRKRHIKRIWLKSAAVLLSFIYLAQPISQPVGQLLHQIVHLLEVPSTLMDYKIDGHHETFAHHQEEDTHEHNFIDLFRSYLEQPFSTESPGESAYFIVKLEKHFAEQNKMEFFSTAILKNNKILKSVDNTLLGHPSKVYKPPQALVL